MLRIAGLDRKTRGRQRTAHEARSGIGGKGAAGGGVARHLGHDILFETWPQQSGWWLAGRQKTSDFYQPKT